MKLANKIALITGAGSGMGRVASLLFAQEGAKIAAIDIDEKAAQETARMIEAGGGKAIAVKADVSKSADAQAMVAATVEKLGALGDEHAIPSLRLAKKKDHDSTPWYRATCLGRAPDKAEKRILTKSTIKA